LLIIRDKEKKNNNSTSIGWDPTTNDYKRLQAGSYCPTKSQNI